MSAERPANLTAVVQHAVNYRGKPFPQTHPDRLATLARLHGISAAAPERCRVLELGCGDGGNVVPLAFNLDKAEFVAVDLEAERIDAGKRWIEDLGLKNLRLEARDICDIGDEYGKFDYIIAHGVYCWVPAHVRDRLFEVCRSLLQPAGLAYVSFNARPGWHFLEYLRDFALLSAQHGLPESPELLLKNIRGLAHLYMQELPAEGGQAQHLKQLFTRLATTSDYLLAFDYLGEISEPVTLSAFVEHAGRYGLRYLSDANYFEVEWRNLPKRLRTALASVTPDPVQREAFADAFTGRLFRRALLCHAAVEPRTPNKDDVPQYQILGSLKPVEAAMPATREGPTSFEGLHGARLSISSPIVKVALARIGEAWPQSTEFQDLVDATSSALPEASRDNVVQVLAAAIWDMFCAGALEMRSTAPHCVNSAPEQPYVTGLARSQAAHAYPVTNQLHDFTKLSDELSRQLFVRLDGKHTRQQLEDELLVLATEGKLEPTPRTVSRAQLQEAIQQHLAAWAKHALLAPKPET